MATKKIGIGIVGLGRAGWDIHVQDTRRRRDYRIVAVADPLPERRAQAERELRCRSYESLSQLLKDTEIDLVTIATPSVAHGPDAKKALRAGKHVVVEKPMAVTVREADSMIAAAKKARRKLFVHQNYRFDRNYTYLKGVVDSGIIGKLFTIQLHMPAFARRYDWQTLAKNGGGVLNNTGPHYVDQIINLLGSPVVEVMGDLQRIASAGDVEDHVAAFLRAKNGCTAQMTISSAQNITPMPPYRWVLCGSYGTCMANHESSTINYFHPNKVKPLKAIDGPVMSRTYERNDLPWRTKTVKAVGPNVGNFYDNVYAALRNRAKLHVTPESAREIIRVIAMIRKGTNFPGRAIAKR